MRIARRSSWFTARAALAMVAIVVQALLPFVVAADIAAAATLPICHVPSGAGDKGGHPAPAKSCPICVALAAAVVVTTPTPPAIPLPRVAIVRLPAEMARDAIDISVPSSYRSRAPPRA